MPVKLNEEARGAESTPSVHLDPFDLNSYGQVFNLVDERLALCPSIFGMPLVNFIIQIFILH